jgi:predicted PurR-regulated permease PerM
MAQNFAKWVSVLAMILAIALFLPGIALASPAIFDTSSTVIIAQTTLSLENDLTPQKRQQLQGIRQRRNKDIQAVLDLSQRKKLTEYVRSGKSINEALEIIKLQPERREMIKAITRIADLKMKDILSRQLAQGQK